MLRWILFKLYTPIVHELYRLLILEKLFNQSLCFHDLCGSISSRDLFDLTPCVSSTLHLISHAHEVAKLWHQEAFVLIVWSTTLLLLFRIYLDSKNERLLLLSYFDAISLGEIIIERHIKSLTVMS